MAEAKLDTRESLKPYDGKRIVIEARLQRFGRYHDYRMYRQVPSADMADVDLIETVGNGKETRFTLTTHVWCTYSDPIRDAGTEPGDVVRMNVLVYSYRQRNPDDHNQFLTRYGLRSPVDVEIISKMTNPLEGPMPGPIRLTTPPISNGIANGAPMQEIPQNADIKDTSSRACLVELMAMIEHFGLAKVEKALAAAKMMEE